VALGVVCRDWHAIFVSVDVSKGGSVIMTVAGRREDHGPFVCAQESCMKNGMHQASDMSTPVLCDGHECSGKASPWDFNARWRGSDTCNSPPLVDAPPSLSA
jgi:hypothetical protein